MRELHEFPGCQAFGTESTNGKSLSPFSPILSPPPNEGKVPTDASDRGLLKPSGAGRNPRNPSSQTCYLDSRTSHKPQHLIYFWLQYTLLKKVPRVEHHFPNLTMGFIILAAGTAFKYHPKPRFPTCSGTTSILYSPGFPQVPNMAYL